MTSGGCSKRRSYPRTLLRAPASALLLMLALGTAAALHAQSDAQLSAQSDERPQAGTYSLLYSFQCYPDGADPQSGLIRDSSGNLYGTTYRGGQQRAGTVFKVTSGGTESVLHSFGSPLGDGVYPSYGNLTLDAAGNLYGTTPEGGQSESGTVFKVTATGTESILYNFCPQAVCTDGAGPGGGMTRDSAGNLYGTTYVGGAYDDGVIFKLTADGTESVLHSFGSSTSDAEHPSSNLTRDSSGNLYGTSEFGGASSDGTVFQATTSGTESVLYSFRGSPIDGTVPYGGGLLRDTTGNLYGVTSAGGANASGVVFKLTSSGTETVLLNFSGGSGGGGPYGGLARDAAGNLYGTTSGGGSGASCGRSGCGVLFRLTTTGKEVVLHDFTLSDGANPYGGVILDPSGNLYGTLSQGGAYGCGAVFKFTP